ncbi:MAG: hypothetical protein ACRDJ4_06440 [Actinomycetota bacterium]
MCASAFAAWSCPTSRPAAKLLDRPDLLDGLKASFRGRPAFIEPWNVTGHEVEVALRLQAPINGTAPELWPLGFKSAGRRHFEAAGVPAPTGREDVRTVDEVVASIAAIRAAGSAAPAVVIKHDNSGAGDGNALIDLQGVESDGEVRRLVEALPEWYLRDLKAGGVVEEMIASERFSSPSVQLEIQPDSEMSVLSTHEQVLGGENHQV